MEPFAFLQRSCHSEPAYADCIRRNKSLPHRFEGHQQVYLLTAGRCVVSAMCERRNYLLDHDASF